MSPDHSVRSAALFPLSVDRWSAVRVDIRALPPEPNDPHERCDQPDCCKGGRAGDDWDKRPEVDRVLWPCDLRLKICLPRAASHDNEHGERNRPDPQTHDE